MTDQIQLEIPLILPDIPDADDACVVRLTADLSARAGIEKAHVVPAIRQNVFVSLGVVAVLVPATILGLGIGPAVAMHEGSTLVVVFNALRLLAFREPNHSRNKDTLISVHD